MEHQQHYRHRHHLLHEQICHYLSPYLVHLSGSYVQRLLARLLGLFSHWPSQGDDEGPRKLSFPGDLSQPQTFLDSDSVI